MKILLWLGSSLLIGLLVAFGICLGLLSLVWLLCPGLRC